MDDIAKRRETRRRKILENSQNRLNRISGVEQKTTRVFPCENHVETPVTPDNPEPPPEVRTEVRQQKIETQTKPLKQYRKTVVSGLAVFVNVLLLIVERFFEPQSTHLHKIFVPLFVYEVSEFLSNHHKTEKRSFIFVILAASSKNPHISTVITYLELVSTIIQDVMVYFFVFVCCEFARYFLRVR